MGNKDIKKKIEEMRTKEITITADKITDASTEVLAKKRWGEMVKKDPMMIMLIALYTADLIKNLFDFDDEEQQEDNE